jgi:formylglycine-generating enzyme required for sulfatase activity
MMGNAWEWVHDWASDSYAACGDACAGIDPRGPCDGAEECPGHDQRVVRGGSWYWPAEYATGTHRRTHFPINEISNFHHFGFRCAASVEQARAMRATAHPPAEPGDAK